MKTELAEKQEKANYLKFKKKLLNSGIKRTELTQLIHRLCITHKLQISSELKYFTFDLANSIIYGRFSKINDISFNASPLYGNSLSIKYSNGSTIKIRWEHDKFKFSRLELLVFVSEL